MARKTHEDILLRGVHDITVRKSLEKKLASGKKLRIKHGVDPTTADLHLGYAVIYRKLRAFQELGHTVIFLIGDFTGRFGDPTDKEKTRVMRSKHDVEAAAKSYIDQIGLMLDTKKLEIRRNSEWYDKMSAEDLLRVMSEFTIARMLERDMFQKRIKEGKEIGLHEPVYPVLQAWDSVQLKSDVTVIGTDQTFNELQARGLQERNGQAPQDVMSMNILVGTDGKKKMSQSSPDHCIGLKDVPEEMYEKIMSIPDKVIPNYAELLTNWSSQAYNNPPNPLAIKGQLAWEIVEWLHGEAGASRAQRYFNRVHRDRKDPDVIEQIEEPFEFKIPISVSAAKLFNVSNSESRRLIEQGGIKFNGRVIKDPNEETKEGVYQKGKRHFKRLVKKK